MKVARVNSLDLFLVLCGRNNLSQMSMALVVGVSQVSSSVLSELPSIPGVLSAFIMKGDYAFTTAITVKCFLSFSLLTQCISLMNFYRLRQTCILRKNLQIIILYIICGILFCWGFLGYIFLRITICCIYFLWCICLFWYLSNNGLRTWVGNSAPSPFITGRVCEVYMLILFKIFYRTHEGSSGAGFLFVESLVITNSITFYVSIQLLYLLK